MSEFEEKLWLQVVRVHGDDLLAGPGTVAHRRAPGSRRQLLAGTTGGLAAIGVAAALLFAASSSPPAFAVTRHADGTVTVRLMRPSGITGANAKLSAMGVRARILALPKQAPNLVCPGGAAPTITFDPASVPARQELVITPDQTGSGAAAASKAPPAGAAIGGDASAGDRSIRGNHVVRMYPGGAGNRLHPDDGNHVARMYCP